MTPAEVRSDLSRFLDACWQAEILVDTNVVVSREDGGGRLITWAAMGDDESPLYAAPTLGEYRRLRQARHYTALLADYSLLQISFRFDLRRTLLQHRLCFYPCPFAVEREDLGGWTLLDYIDAMSDFERIERLRLESPLRFDYDALAARPGHPASHLTIARDGCRIPVFAPLSLGHFIRFVFSSFYPEWWKRHPFLREWPLRWSERSIEDHECHHLFIECRRAVHG